MRLRPTAIVLALLVSIVALPVSAVPNRIAVLQTLDKVTARVNTVKVPVGSSFQLGTLVVKVDHCDKRPPEEPPESAAFVSIDEERADEGTKTRVFSGWMFASSPALHALEHPVYDVWLKDCEEPIKNAEHPNEAPQVPAASGSGNDVQTVPLDSPAGSGQSDSNESNSGKSNSNN